MEDIIQKRLNVVFFKNINRLGTRQFLNCLTLASVSYTISISKISKVNLISVIFLLYSHMTEEHLIGMICL